MEQRRTTGRARALKSAKIVFSGDSASIDCVVRNSSASGACLDVASPIGIPESFDLVYGADRARTPCRVVWRKANRIGVEFEHRQ
jgi:PilZ domain